MFLGFRAEPFFFFFTRRQTENNEPDNDIPLPSDCRQKVLLNSGISPQQRLQLSDRRLHIGPCFVSNAAPVSRSGSAVLRRLLLTSSQPLGAYGNINWAGWSLAAASRLDGLSYNAKCYCVSEVLHTSCPASQAPSPKLLSGAFPPSGTSGGGAGVGGSIRLGGYWRDWKWLEVEKRLPRFKINTESKAEEIMVERIGTEDIEEHWFQISTSPSGMEKRQQKWNFSFIFFRYTTIVLLGPQWQDVWQ